MALTIVIVEASNAVEIAHQTPPTVDTRNQRRAALKNCYLVHRKPIINSLGD